MEGDQIGASAAAAETVAAKRVLPVVVGTRPEAIKLVPLILALRESAWFEPVVVSTGQHHAMVDEVFGFAGIRPDVTLLAGDRHARLNERVATVMGRFEDFICQMYGSETDPTALIELARAGRYPAAVAVHGDTSSAMAAALAAFHLRIPVIHVEAGLRTGGLNLTPFPEELNRQVITCIAALHLAPTSVNEENLIHENVPGEQIFVTGNTGIDALHWAAELDVPFRDPAVQEAVDSGDRLVVVTAHRRENWGEGLDQIAAGVATLASRRPEVQFIVPMHPNPSVREQLQGPLGGLDNVLLTEPLRFAAFARLQARCDVIITDSGGIQEEAPSLGKPVMVTRETTERVEGVEAGTLLLVGADAERIAAEGERLLSDPIAYAEIAEAPNPYGDGHAAERIVAAFEHIMTDREPPAPFGPGYSRRAILMAAGRSVPLRAAEVATQQRSEEVGGAPGASEVVAP